MTRFDEIYQSQENYYPRPTKALSAYVLVRGLVGKHGADLGAGNGRNALMLASLGARVDAYDESSVAMNELTATAGRHAMQVNCRVKDVRQVAYDPASLDFVVASTILDHLPSSDSILVLHRMWRWIRISGWLYVSTFTTEDPSASPGTATAAASETADHIVNHFEPQQLLHSMQELGGIVRYYSESVETDTSHGTPHKHGIARAVVERWS
jgi:2-polyprenyl-3-methyl-5-hydroxy-6-metoxy-1,4-benzoquinol methylase